MTHSSLQLIFLGDSQTFVGVLASTIVLCILVGKSNFIFNILSTISQKLSKVKGESQELYNKIDLDDIKESSHYKLVKMHAKNESASPLDNALRRQDLISSIEFKKLAFRERFLSYAIYSEKAIDPKNQPLIFAPLYTFGYVLMLFVFDEFLRIGSPKLCDILVSSLAIFTSLSISLWLIIWIIYTIYVISGRPKGELPKSNWLAKCDKHLSHKHLTVSLMLKVLVWAAFIGIVITIIHFIAPQLLRFKLLTWGLILVVPFCIIGAIKESSHQVIEGEKEDMYEYGTLIGHFIMIFIISVAFGWLSVHVMMKSDTLGQLIMYIDNTFVLKCFCIGFTILNGLLLPFLLPLGCYEICRCREWWLRRKAYRGAKKFKKVFLDKLAKEAGSIKVD